VICYQDRTFCNAACGTTGCDRRLTDDVWTRARKWWGTYDAPVAISNMRASCLEFTPTETEKK
jgi:hypothetical protein